MNKKLLGGSLHVLWVTALFALSATLALSVGGQPAQSFSYAPTEGGVTVTGYFGEGLETVSVPELLGGQPVVAISSGAFLGNKSVRSIELPETVTTIGNNAFTGCENLHGLLAAGVTGIGDYAFYGCTQLTLLTVGRLEQLGEQALGNARPTVSVGKSAGISGFVATRRIMQESYTELPLGKAGGLQITDVVMEQYGHLDEYLAPDVQDIDLMWSIGLPDYYSGLHKSGLFALLDADEREGLELRMQALLDDLAANVAMLGGR